jgi:hypothetical protein
MPVDKESKAGNYVGARPKDESKLSRDPAQIRRRLRRAAKGDKKRDGRIARDMEMLYQKPLEEWDLEELARGRPRDKNGKFTGRLPSWCGANVQMEAKRRLITETRARLAGHADLAIRTLGNLLVSDECDMNGKPIVDAKTKYAAAAFILEHTIGKPQALVSVEVSEPKKAIAAAIILDDGAPQGHFGGNIIEGEAEWDDDEDKDDDDGDE